MTGSHTSLAPTRNICVCVCVCSHVCVWQSSLHEGIALALLSMKESYTVAEKKGSLTSEDLVRSLTAVMCDFEMPLPFSTAADLASAGPGTTAASAPSATRSNVTSSKDGMTPGQLVFYDKIIKPRKPGEPTACTCFCVTLLHTIMTCLDSGKVETAFEKPQLSNVAKYVLCVFVWKTTVSEEYYRARGMCRQEASKEEWNCCACE
jgi:hypothetical protein